MGEILKRRLKQGRFQSLEQETLLNLIVAGNFVRDLLDQACGDFGITHQQYNILRILRGASPKPLSTLQIRERMLDKMSDTSRIVDRLVAKNLVMKSTCAADKRLVDVVITDKGQSLLSRIDSETLDLFQHPAIGIEDVDHSLLA